MRRKPGLYTENPEDKSTYDERASTVDLLELPRSEVTLAAIDVLLENPGVRMNGLKLMQIVKERLGRDVNYSGVIKQVRVYAKKPYWGNVLKAEKHSALSLYSTQTALTEKLHNLVHRLYTLSHTLYGITGLQEELKNLDENSFNNPYVDVQEVKRKQNEIEQKLDQLVQQIQ